MTETTIYCSACDHEVRVVGVEPASGTGGPDVIATDTGVCLDIGTLCTGALCPLFDVSPAEMRARLHEYEALTQLARTTTEPREAP